MEVNRDFKQIILIFKDFRNEEIVSFGIFF